MEDYDSLYSQEEDSVADYLKDIAGFPYLTIEEEKALVQKIKEGDRKAFEELVNRHLKTVVKIVDRKYPNRKDKMDLIQAGNVGLLSAAKTLGFSEPMIFRTYAYSIIERKCEQYLHEMDYSMSLKPARYRVMKNIENNIRPDEYTEKELMRYNICTAASFEEALEEEDNNLSLLSYDLNYQQTGSDDISPDDCEKIRNVIKSLEKQNPRYAQVIKMRFGFSGYPAMTLQEVAEKMGVTDSRVRQIEAKALRKLRHPSGGLGL